MFCKINGFNLLSLQNIINPRLLLATVENVNQFKNELLQISNARSMKRLKQHPFDTLNDCFVPHKTKLVQTIIS